MMGGAHPRAAWAGAPKEPPHPSQLILQTAAADLVPATAADDIARLHGL